MIKSVESRSIATKLLSRVLCLIFLTAFLNGCDLKKEAIFKETRASMYTIVSITVVSDSPGTVRKATEESYAELDRIAALLNFYDDKSELSSINRQAGITPVKVSGETLGIIEESVNISKMTEGAFDVTVGTLVKLWDMKKQIIPDKKLIDQTRKSVGYGNIVIDRAASTVFIKKEGASIDLGGIVKGYAADRVVDILKRNGITSGIAAIGGEVRAFGKRPDGQPWVVGIQNPRQKGTSDEIIATIEISDKAMSTSGDYNKYFEKDGRRYHHLIDPKTGSPSRRCGSTTVIAKDATTSDGFSKLFILGPKKGIVVAKKVGFDVIFIDCDGRVSMTEGIKERVKFIRQ
jgi:thiamine biosynthesis lipoprotein